MVEGALELTVEERAMLAGERGPAAATAMRILVETARAMGAPRFVEVSRAHVDGCLYHGRAGLDFAERLLAEGARVSVPTTLNVGLLDLLHPELVRTDPETRGAARRLMEAYVAMGCRPTWTCAPYQLPEARPGLGEQVAWAESNAIVFANSVLGARTERYGDFLDICAAVAGRAPYVGLHTDEGRRARVAFRLEGVPERLLASDVCYPVLGHLVGRAAGSRVPAIVGLPPDASEDRLKALGAAAASSGSVGMFHAVGVTPEAPTLEAATGGAAVPEVAVTPERLRRARDELTTAGGDELAAVSVGTPHASVAELERLAELLDGVRIAPGVGFYVNTSRASLAEAERRGVAEALARAGVRIVTDTCTYLAPIIAEVRGPVMTNSAKWAWYAPGNLGIEVVFGSLEECVRSAALGRVVRDERLWS
ncbi:MAG TPA: aconitase X catalytic domain-containing protein [Actinomycetota bacterium]|nr:aconitase X catalytic domain-containing protein [Actinomycetota bacterium]